MPYICTRSVKSKFTDSFIVSYYVNLYNFIGVNNPAYETAFIYSIDIIVCSDLPVC